MRKRMPRITAIPRKKRESDEAIEAVSSVKAVKSDRRQLFQLCVCLAIFAVLAIVKFAWPESVPAVRAFVRDNITDGLNVREVLSINSEQLTVNNDIIVESSAVVERVSPSVEPTVSVVITAEPMNMSAIDFSGDSEDLDDDTVEIRHRYKKSNGKSENEKDYLEISDEEGLKIWQRVDVERPDNVAVGIEFIPLFK